MNQVYTDLEPSDRITAEAHIQAILRDFNRKAYRKYMKGVEEHGEGLWSVPPLTVIEYAMEEAIDEYVYLYTLKEQLEKNRGTDL